MKQGHGLVFQFLIKQVSYKVLICSRVSLELAVGFSLNCIVLKRGAHRLKIKKVQIGTACCICLVPVPGM